MRELNRQRRLAGTRGSGKVGHRNNRSRGHGHIVRLGFNVAAAGTGHRQRDRVAPRVQVLVVGVLRRAGATVPKIP